MVAVNVSLEPTVNDNEDLFNVTPVTETVSVDVESLPLLPLLQPRNVSMTIIRVAKFILFMFVSFYLPSCSF